MNRVKLTRLRRWSLYAVAAGLWLSGGLWLVAHYYWIRQGAFGPETSPAEQWSLDIHGGFAMAALWFTGLLWGVHIVPGWHSRRGRWSGGAMAGLLLLLAVTGYLLYYLGDEDTRGWASVIHWVVGLVTLPLFLLHRFTRKRAAPQRR
jgi:MFS family permease